MPSTLTYPGVYIEELPSGVRTITGVSTSVAAFVGWCAKGPIDRAGNVFSFSDFERIYGGLDERTPLGHSVKHFFDNGGQEAYIVRLVDEGTARAGEALFGDLKLEANSPGKWSSKYSVSITDNEDNPAYFRLAVKYVIKNEQGQKEKEEDVEIFEKLSASPDDPRFIDSVVSSASAFITVKSSGDPIRNQTVEFSSGDDGTVLKVNDGNFEPKLVPKVKELLANVPFNLLCVPGQTEPNPLEGLQNFCREKRAFLIVDCKQDATLDSVQNGLSDLTKSNALNSAIYFPWIKAPNPLKQNRLEEYPPCGFIAGIYARTDANRGVWKAPAGIDASVSGALDLKVRLTNGENGKLNQKGVNCIRDMPDVGTVLWGARTLHGADSRASEWKYIPVRRTALFIEESLYRGTQWVVFEPNDEPLWAQIRLNIGSFMHNLFRQGAFQGKSPREAYFVNCDSKTTTQADINLGIVNIHVGFAPLKPAEFVVIKLQQMAGQIEV